MISGIAVAAKSLKPSIKILAAEPTGRNDAADAAAAKAAGALVLCAKPDTIADGLQGAQLRSSLQLCCLVVLKTLQSCCCAMFGSKASVPCLDAGASHTQT